MITRNMKISKMLNDYPETLEVLLEASPHFNKLKNKVLRKALASRVNIEQAAGIAGVDLSDLLFKLNRAINITAQPQISKTSDEIQTTKTNETSMSILEKLNQSKIIELDVRPIIESGNDPFLDIMAKAKTVEETEILLIINSFEPVPLYSVLGKKGFEYETIKKDDAFYIYFYKKEINAGSLTRPANESIYEETSPHDYEKVIELDVRELEPPEPMVKILETLNNIDAKTVLVVHHHREPLMLYPKLEERGFRAISNKISENYYKVVIMKKEGK